MKSLAVLLGLVISTIAASTASAIARGHAGALAGSPQVPTCTASPGTAASSGERPFVHLGEVLIENEPGVYIVAPRFVAETTTSQATARPASVEPAAPSGERPLVHPGEVLIENEPGVYIVAPHAVRETKASPATARTVRGRAVTLCN